MITLTITPRAQTNLYGLLTKKESDLRKANKGTLFRSGEKKSGQARWKHVKHPGWIRQQKCLGNVVVATFQSQSPDGEWQLFSSFVGFLDRHFRGHIASMNVVYGEK
jgi:hypothetical protein